VLPAGPGPAGVLPAPPPDDPLPARQVKGQVKGALRASRSDRSAIAARPL